MCEGAECDDVEVQWDQAEEKGSSKIPERRVQALDSTADDFERLSETIEKSGLPIAASQRGVQKKSNLNACTCAISVPIF